MEMGHILGDFGTHVGSPRGFEIILFVSTGFGDRWRQDLVGLEINFYHLINLADSSCTSVKLAVLQCSISTNLSISLGFIGEDGVYLGQCFCEMKWTFKEFLPHPHALCLL